MGLCSFGVAPRAVPVDPVVGTLGTQLGGERERLARLLVTTHRLEASAEAEERAVVRWRLRGDSFELAGRVAKPLRVEVGTAKRLADGRLVRLELGGLAQGDAGGVVVA